MNQEVIVSAVKEFITEQKFHNPAPEVAYTLLNLDSMEYISLILYIENKLNVIVDEGIFFKDNIPEVETFDELCARLFLSVSHVD